MPPLTRRAVLGQVAAGGAAVVLAGCSQTDGTAAPVRRRTRAQLSADELVVVDLVGRLATSTAALVALSTAYPGLGRELAGLLATQRAHLAELSRSARSGKLPVGSPSAAATATPPPKPTARTTAVADAQALRAAYLHGAQDAESGQFARLLASMACALSQRLDGLA